MFGLRSLNIGFCLIPVFLFLVTATQGQEKDQAIIRGEQLVTRLGCMECHTVHGKGAGIFSEVTAPEWAGSLGKKIMMDNGEEVEVSWDYLLKSITEPDAQIVKGYEAGKMPTKFAHLPKKDLAAIVAFIESLSPSEDSEETAEAKKNKAEARGEKLVQWLGCMKCHNAHGTAPDWADTIGTTQEMEDGQEVEITWDYIFNSITKPADHIVLGYADEEMPKWFAELPEKDLAAIVAYIEKQLNSSSEAGTSDDGSE